MEIKINEADIIKHNKHILAVSGGDFGVFQKSELDFIVDVVNNEKEPINQATDFLFYGVSNHPFLNGNKRTAFEVAKGIMASGALILGIPESEVISFVTGSLVQGKATKIDVKDWLVSHSKPVSEKPDFNEVTSQNIEKDKKLLKKLD